VSGTLTSALVALEPRMWAKLLRALRRLPEVPTRLSELLDLPTSTLASGPKRAELCRVLAADDGTLAVLRAEAALPAQVRAALDADDGSDDVDAADATGDAGATGDERAEERARTLRRRLEEERRRREGAEARAQIAEARAAGTAEEHAELLARIAGLEDEVARARDAVAQATARTERRSASRIAELERELANERSTLAALRREHERSGAELEGLRQALDELRARVGTGGREPRTTVREEPGGRPLVLPDELEPDTTPAARWLLERARLLLVDGYNVAFALRAGRPLEEQRRWLVDRLRPLAARGGVTPVVVFDGDGAGSARREPSGVEVRFTARGTLADDDIVFVVAATAEPVVVITDDAELRERVRAEGGNVLGTVQFLGAIDA